ncbi:hypothetical protein AWT69_000852 [Pseudomonas putida]|nr:hypothetical protein AWT69_000852 [Pseudomonas putida]
MASCRQATCTDCTHITQTKDADTHRIHLMCLSRPPFSEEPTGLIDQQFSGARIHGELTLHRTQA